MTMMNRISKLDDFLKISNMKLLSHTEGISHKMALEKTQLEYEKFYKKQLEQPTEVERHFIEAEMELKAIKTATKQ